MKAYLSAWSKQRRTGKSFRTQLA